MAYEINFCETKEQLKHLAEVVTGKAEGSPTGADIDTSTLAYAGLVRDTLPELLSKLGWYSVGDWSSDPLISNDNEYVLYNGIRYVPLSIPYQVDSTTNPDPEVLVGTELKVITDVTNEDITEAQNDIVGGSIFKGSNGETVENGDFVESGITHLRVLFDGKPTIVVMSPVASGVVSSLTETGATIGTTQVNFRRLETLSFETLDQALHYPFVFVGMSADLKERTSGLGAGAIFDVVLTSSVTPNGFDIVQSVSSPIHSFVLRKGKTLDPAEFGCGEGGDDTLAFKRFIEVMLSGSYDVKSSPKKTYNLTDYVTSTGDGTQEIEFDLNSSVLSINHSILRAVEFKNLRRLTTKNTKINCNGGTHFGLVVEQITHLDVQPSTEVYDISENNDEIIVGVFVRDCKFGFLRPTVSDVINIPVIEGTPSGVARGAMVSDQLNDECHLTVSPIINNVPGTADGDGFYAEYSGAGNQADIKGGLKVIGGVYNNCGKRNIKLHMPNNIVSSNSGRNDTENPMYAFISAYGGSSTIKGNKMNCKKHVTYKTEVLSDLLPSSINADYIITDNQFFAGVNPVSNDTDYLLNIQVSSTPFGAIYLGDNQDKGAGRCIRGFNNNVGVSLKAKNNQLQDISSTPFNINNITLNELDISYNFSPDVTSYYLVAMNGVTVESTKIIGNSGDYSFGTIQADADFRPRDMYGNGSNIRSTSVSEAEYKDGVKYVYQNNTEPSSGKYLNGDRLLNNVFVPGGWAEKVVTTGGDASLGEVVWKISQSIEA